MDLKNLDESSNKTSPAVETDAEASPITELCDNDVKLDAPRDVTHDTSSQDDVSPDVIANDNEASHSGSDTDTASETEDCFVDAIDHLNLNASGAAASSLNSAPNLTNLTSDPCTPMRGYPFQNISSSHTKAESNPTHFDDDDDDEGERFRRMEEEGKGSEEVKADVIDEEALKAAEALLSEEEIESRKAESRRLKELGNEQYKMADCAGAASTYTDALVACLISQQEERAVLYANRAAAQMRMDKNDAALADCSRALTLNPDYMKALLRRAELYERTDKLDEALADYQRALERDPGLHQARAACLRLPEQIQARNEKLKTEMLGKLKDLGNLVLRPFGLSTDNFKMQQDPATGSYSINFQQKSS